MSIIKLMDNKGKIIKDFGNVPNHRLTEVYNKLPNSFKQNEQLLKLMKAVI